MAEAAQVPLEATPNPRRRLEIRVGDRTYVRLPVRTHVVTDRDDIVDLLDRYAGPLVQPGTYLEPFALRTLGFVRRDPDLMDQAVDRFEALGLDWHAAQTRDQLRSRRGDGHE